MFIDITLAPVTMRLSMRRARTAALLLVLLLLTTSSPLALAAGGRALDIALFANPMAQTVNPGENGTYIITVTNTGDDDMTVQLTTQEGQDCQGFTSTIQQIPGVIESGNSETTDLSVQVASGAEGDCETTVTGIANSAPGETPSSPAQADVTVTTTAGDGSGNALFGVALTSGSTDRTFEGNNPVRWPVTVENTGQQNETISLEMVDNSTCTSSLSAEVDPTQVVLDSEDTEVVQVEVTVPDGTEAGEHCFTLEAVVTNDPNQQEQASDSIQLRLTVPEMHECTAALNDASMSVDPGETLSNTVTFTNTGNADWTIRFSPSGPRNWVSVVGGSTHLLPYSGGTGTVSFDFTVSPDDSMPANTEIPFSIDGYDDQSNICSADLTLILGQSHAADIDLQSTRISDVEPGTTVTTQVTVSNLGNGAETFSIGTSNVPGWTTSFETGTITLNGRHDSSGTSGSLTLSISAPQDALATDELLFTVSVSSSGGSTTYVSEDITVTVAAHREMSASMVSLEQWGSTGQIAKFPVVITNEGNIRDPFRLSVCDDPPSSNPNLCASPVWDSRFSDSAGSEITSISLDPGQTVTVWLDVTIQGELERDSEKFQVRVRNQNEISVEERFDIVCIVSNFDYRMAITLQEPGEIPDLLEVSLPPEGEITVIMFITDVGNSSFPEDALITLSGMGSTVETIITVNGSVVTGPFPVPKGVSLEVRLTLTVLEGVPDGQSGTITISVASTRNAAEPSEVRVQLTVNTVRELEFTVDGPESISITYGEVARMWVNVSNKGNVEQNVELSSSDPLRGWSIEVLEEELTLAPGQSESVEVIVKPPTDLTQPDTFTFTVYAQPEGDPDLRQPIDMQVTAAPAKSLFGTSDSIGLAAMGLLLLLVALALVTMSISRREEA